MDMFELEELMNPSVKITIETKIKRKYDAFIDVTALAIKHGREYERCKNRGEKLLKELQELYKEQAGE